MKLLSLLSVLVPMIFAAQDFANFTKYEKENTVLKSQNIRPNTVFMGDSITEFWKTNDPDFFLKNNFADRGISGQVSSQMLLRFREDVINLNPTRVVILAGTNDIAENQGPISLERVLGNIISMAELARANRIKVVLCSVLPAYEFGWRKGLKPADKVIELNKMIREYALKNKIPYVDYFAQMKDARNGLDAQYTQDEIHPTKAGYQKMEEIVMKVLK